jgi:hypothetical protein
MAFIAVELSVVEEGAKAMAEVAMSAETAAAKDFMVEVYGSNCTRCKEKGYTKEKQPTTLPRRLFQRCRQEKMIAVEVLGRYLWGSNESSPDSIMNASSSKNCFCLSSLFKK